MRNQEAVMSRRRRRAVVGAIGGGGFVNITDSFTDTDGTLLEGRTTDTGNKIWISWKGSFKILGNQLAPSSAVGGDVDVIDAGIADGEFGFTLGTSYAAALILRASDISNYWLTFCDATHIYLQTLIAGVISTKASPTAAPVAGSVISVACSGTSLQLKHNGVLIGTPVTNVFNADKTFVGPLLKSGTAVARWDNFFVTQ